MGLDEAGGQQAATGLDGFAAIRQSGGDGGDPAAHDPHIGAAQTVALVDDGIPDDQIEHHHS